MSILVLGLSSNLWQVFQKRNLLLKTSRTTMNLTRILVVTSIQMAANKKWNQENNNQMKLDNSPDLNLKEKYRHRLSLPPKCKHQDPYMVR